MTQCAKRIHTNLLHLDHADRVRLALVVAFLHQAGQPLADDWRKVAVTLGAPTEMLPRHGDANDALTALRVMRSGGLADAPLGEIARTLDGTLGYVGTFYPTPAPIARVMAEATVRPGDRVLDPACGAGALLWAAAARGAETLIGIERDPFALLLAHMEGRLCAEAANATLDLRAGDGLESNETCDVILANPPFARASPLDRLTDDLRGARDLAAAFLARIVGMLSVGQAKRAAVIVPEGLLSANDPFAYRVRRAIVEHGLLRGVISLPPGAFAPWTDVKTSILVMGE